MAYSKFIVADSGLQWFSMASEYPSAQPYVRGCLANPSKITSVNANEKL